MQSRKHSFYESVINVLIGYSTAIVGQVVVFPWFDINIPLSDNLMIGAIFTFISIARSYVIRRWFTARTENPR